MSCDGVGMDYFLVPTFCTILWCCELLCASVSQSTESGDRGVVCLCLLHVDYVHPQPLSRISKKKYISMGGFRPTFGGL